MKKSFLLAMAASVFSLTSCTNNSVIGVESEQRECLNFAQEAISDPSFNSLPSDLKLKVLQFVPLQCASVCCEWMEMTRERRKVKHFERLLKVSVAEMNPEVDYFERHFDSEKERNRVVSKAIASHYNQLLESAGVKRKDDNNSMSSNTLNKKNIMSLLGTSQMIKMLPKMLSTNPKLQLFNLLGGLDGFSEIPLKVRQYIATEVMWTSTVYEANVCSLSCFLSSFHDKFDMIKDVLCKVNSRIVAKACVKIALGIDCVKLAANDRQKLFDRIRLAFSADWTIGRTRSVLEKLSFNSSISDILAVEQEYKILTGIIFDTLYFNQEYLIADWCMRLLRRPNLSLLLINARLNYLIINEAFLKKHQISLNEQSVLLKSCDPNEMLTSLPHSGLDGLDTKVLVQWLNENPDQRNTLSFRSLIILYSLDDDDDDANIDTLNKYSKSLLQLKQPEFDLFIHSKIALGTDYGRYLSCNKKVALLKCLYPNLPMDHLEASLKNNDRKLLITDVAALFNDCYDANFADSLSDSDLLLWVETCLEYPEKYTMPSVLYRESESAVRVLIKYIGNDLGKLTNYKGLSEYHQVMMFLLTEHDEIADLLSRNEAFKKVCWMGYFTKIRSNREEAARAAQRIHKYNSKQSQQTKANNPC